MSRSAEDLDIVEISTENKENQQNEEISQRKKANTLVIEPVSQIKLNDRFRSFRSKKDSLIENINYFRTFISKKESLTEPPNIIIKEEPGEQKSHFEAEVEEKVIILCFLFILMKFLKIFKILIDFNNFFFLKKAGTVGKKNRRY